MTRSGKRETQMALVLRVVWEYPGCTASALGDITNLGHVPCQRRLSDLLNQYLVYQGAPQQVGQRWQVTWWPTQAEKQGKLVA